jgi:methylthioribulose-1-phosphate dehydratase
MKKRSISRRSAAGVLAAALAETGRNFHARGWALGTSGNFSAVLCHEPLRLLITTSGLDKSELRLASFLEIDEQRRVLRGNGKPSAEALLHIAVARARHAGSVLHTHSVWSTLLSELHCEAGSLTIAGYEMLKGLEGVTSHVHGECLPILKNSQDIPALAAEAEAALKANPAAHGFLIGGHGLYTWGEGVAQARRHVEILEFLLEVTWRAECEGPASRHV